MGASQKYINLIATINATRYQDRNIFQAKLVILLSPLVVVGSKDRAPRTVCNFGATFFFSGPPRFAPRDITRINQRVRASSVPF